MDNASGNVPNVILSPGHRPEEGEETYANQGFGEMIDHTLPPPVFVPMPSPNPDKPMLPGMMESLLPQQAPPSRPQRIGVALDTNTLDNQVRLLAPTPIDIDPPPLQDVRPLSATGPNPISAQVHKQFAENPVPNKLVSVSHLAPPVLRAQAGAAMPVLVNPAVSKPSPMPVFLIPQVDAAKTRASRPGEEPNAHAPTLVGISNGPNHPEPESEPAMELPLAMDPEAIEPEAMPINEELLLVSQDEPEVLAEHFQDQYEPEATAEEEVEVEAEKTEFERATLAADSKITQKVLITPDPKAEVYVKNEFFVSEGAEDPWILPAMATSGLSANHKKKGSQGRSQGSFWSIFTSIFFFGTLILIGAAAILWSMRGGIVRKFEASLAQKVEDAGYFASYDGWKYDPVRGVVLEGVTIFESANKIVPYAKVSNIGLNSDFYTLWKTGDLDQVKKVLSFKGSQLSLFEKGAQVADFKSLKGSIELDQNRVAIEDLQGQIEGMLFEVEGNVTLPEGDDKEVAIRNPDHATSSTPTSGDLIQKLAENLPNPGTLAQQSGPVILTDEPIETKEASEGLPKFAPRKDIVLPLPEPDSPEAKSAPVVDAPKVAGNIIAPPVIEATPVIAPPVVENPTSTSVPDRIEIPPVNSPSNSGGDGPGALPSLALLGEITKYLKVKSEGALPLITSKVDVDLTNQAQPKIKASGRFTGDSITLEETILGGMTFKAFDAAYSYDHENAVLTLPNFIISHGKSGTLNGSATYTLNDQMLDLTEVRSNLDLVAFLTEINPELKQSLENLKFLDSPEIHITTGRVPVASPLDGSLDFSYEQWAGLEVQMEDGKKLSVNQIHGNFKLGGGELAIPSLKAKVFDGDLDAQGSLMLKDPSRSFNGKVAMRGLSMESIGAYSGIKSQAMSGQLDVDYQGTAAKEIQNYTGVGFVDLKNSQLYEVPVIGPIHRLLGAAMPVFGSQNLSTAAGNFMIKEGVLMTTDLTVRSDGTRVLVKGQANLIHQLTAFSAAANLEGPLGAATGLVTEMIEVEGRGPLNNPQIRLKGGALPAAFDSDRVRNLLGISEGSAEAMKAVMEQVAGGTGGVGGLIKSVTAPRPSAEVVKPPTGGETVAPPKSGATGIIEGLKNNNPAAVTEGLRGLLGGQQ